MIPELVPQAIALLYGLAHAATWESACETSGSWLARSFGKKTM